MSSILTYPCSPRQTKTDDNKKVKNPRFPHGHHTCIVITDEVASNLYSVLTFHVTRWVWSAYIPVWLEKDEIIADIIQETFEHLLKRLRRTDLPPVDELEFFAIRTAKNRYLDMVRKDKKFVYLVDPYTASNPCSYRVHLVIRDWLDLSEVATQQAYIEELFNILVAEIVTFSPKMRQALLIDISSRMTFIGEPSPLQKAFLQAGINLQDYCNMLPTDALNKSRFSSHLTNAYRRISELECIKVYTDEVA